MSKPGYPRKEGKVLIVLPTVINSVTIMAKHRKRRRAHKKGFKHKGNFVSKLPGRRVCRNKYGKFARRGGCRL